MSKSNWLSLLVFVDHLLSDIKVKIGTPLCFIPSFVNLWVCKEGLISHREKQPGNLPWARKLMHKFLRGFSGGRNHMMTKDPKPQGMFSSHHLDLGLAVPLWVSKNAFNKSEITRKGTIKCQQWAGYKGFLVKVLETSHTVELGQLQNANW